MQHARDHLDMEALVELVRVVRPPKPQDTAHAIAEIEKLTAFMHAYPDLRQALRQQLDKLLGQNRHLLLYTDAGILSDRAFGAETLRKMSFKLLPPLQDPQDLMTCMGRLFAERHDHLWVSAVPIGTWVELLRAMGYFSPWQYHNTLSHTHEQLLNACLILAQRITSIGLEQDIIEKLPETDDLQSPFFTLNREISHYVERYLQNPYHHLGSGQEDYKQIIVLLRQCEALIHKLKRQKDLYGISLRLTHLMRRLEQHIQRLKTILLILQAASTEQQAWAAVSLFQELVRSENEKYSLRKHFDDNLGLLAFKIIENTSKTGSHYITDSWPEYWRMFRAAAGGGLVVAFLCCLKVYVYYQHFPPFGEAFFYSMIYALGFILIYLCHFTLATKQPAMTASTIAEALDRRHGKPDLRQTMDLLIRISRTQFIALAGNVVMAFPMAWLLGQGFFWLTGTHIAVPAKAAKMVSEIHPVESGSLIFAGIAGIFLMTSGLIAGYYDNKVVYARIPERLRAHPWLQKLLPASWLYRLTEYLHHGFGGLASNFYLGIFLGSMSTLGFILGLALDIRHVTFSAASFGLALAGLEYQITWTQVAWTLAGIGGIGLINVIVSFGLSILIALRSRNMSVRSTLGFFGQLSLLFFVNPWPFLFPPKTAPVAHADTAEDPKTDQHD